MKFGNLTIHYNKPTIIAEAGVNHNCNFNLAKKYVNLAKNSGVDAIKFQTYKAESLVAENSPSYWDNSREKTKSQFQLFKRYEKFNFDHYYKLKKLCDKSKLSFMTTVFDHNEIDKYDPILDLYKISSSDITNIPLLRKIGTKKKFVCLSTGASTLKEINFALKVLNLPKKKICIMHCVLNYPTKDIDANLGYIKILKSKFPGYLIGYSDHTLPDENLTSLITAYQLGAQIIEKHFTHNKKLKGNDHYHAMDINNVKNFYIYLKKINDLTRVKKDKLSTEKKSIKYARRGIYALKNIKKNEIFSISNMTTKRPNHGLSAIEWDKIIGKKSLINIKKSQPIKKKSFYK
jgi:N-acetylneuraminate synthase